MHLLHGPPWDWQVGKVPFVVIFIIYRLIRSKEKFKYLGKLDEYVKKLKFPIQIMSMHNATMDIISITSNLKKGGGQWYMWGQS